MTVAKNLSSSNMVYEVTAVNKRLPSFRLVMWSVLQEKRLQTLLKMIQHMAKINNSF